MDSCMNARRDCVEKYWHFSTINGNIKRWNYLPVNLKTYAVRGVSQDVAFGMWHCVAGQVFPVVRRIVVPYWGSGKRRMNLTYWTSFAQWHWRAMTFARFLWQYSGSVLYSWFTPTRSAVVRPPSWYIMAARCHDVMSAIIITYLIGGNCPPDGRGRTSTHGCASAAALLFCLFAVISLFQARWSLYVPPGLTFSNSPSCPHTVFMCFAWISEQKAIISQ